MSCADPQVPATPVTIVAGSSKALLVTVQDVSKAAVGLTGASIWFTVKNRVEDVNAAIAKRNVAAGGVDGQILISTPQTGATKGQFTIFLVPADTALLDPDASYWCDCWVQLPAGSRYQVITNRQFKITPAVTTQF